MRNKFIALMAASVASLFTASAFAQDSNSLLLPPATYPQGQNAPAANPASAQSMPLGTGQAPVKTQEELDREANNKALNAALDQIYPVTPEQMKQSRERGDALDKAQGEPLTPINAVSRSVRVSLRSGDRPPLVKTAPGWISTITFGDVTGQPWPVLSVTNGNPDAYDVKSSGQTGSSNIVTISTKQAYTPSNIAVTLVGAKVPVMITLMPNRGGDVDFRVDAQIDERGPNAAYEQITSDSLPPTSDGIMLNFLDGVPPSDAVKLKTSDSQTQAWRFNDMLYVRTTKSLLSPAYVSKQSNVVGVNVYVLNEAPVMVMSGSGDGPDAGRLDSVTIQR